MTKQDLKQELDELTMRHEKEKYALYRKYALANNPYNIGDIVTDHIGTVRIEKIKVYVSLSDPQCVYMGTQLDKKGNPTKRQDHTAIYQSNIKP